MNSAAKDAKAAGTKATSDVGDTVSDAAKEARSSAKSEAGSALGEIKGVFGIPKPSSKKPPKK